MLVIPNATNDGTNLDYFYPHIQEISKVVYKKISVMQNASAQRQRNLTQSCAISMRLL